MDKIKDNIKAEILSIKYFCNCCLDKELDFDFPVLQLETWGEAQKYFLEEDWENTTLEFRNELTEYLSKENYELFDCWNDCADDGRKFLENKIENALIKYQEENQLGVVFIDCVKWDLLNAMLYLQYLNYFPQLPDFYEKLLLVYKAGHFPCGWKDDEKNGTLLIV